MENQNEQMNFSGNHLVQQTSLQIFFRFLKFGFLAWSGPIAQIAIIRQELVEEEKWVSREHFNRTLAVYRVLPGPEAHELCVYFGMLAGGRWGGYYAGGWLGAFIITAAIFLPAFCFTLIGYNFWEK